jgi:4-hydroxy-tetrahydrodipicolinate synthase
MKTTWQGVFPAITTQMTRTGALDLQATVLHAQALIDSGITGLICLGSLGENQSLAPDEKRLLLEALISRVDGQVPVLTGVAESSLTEAVRFVQDAEAMGADGAMVMPSMVYRSPDPRERLAWFQGIARATGLPLMIYNNPISYGNDLPHDLLAQLAESKNYIALKESSGDPRRITDLHNHLGNRFALFTGVDDLILESAVLGIDGWVAGTGIAFPKENQALWDLTRQGRWDEARKLYRWFSPLLHLDVHPKFVQYIKLAVQCCGLGSEWVRPPRLPLVGRERRAVLETIEHGVATRPRLARLQSPPRRHPQA